MIWLKVESIPWVNMVSGGLMSKSLRQLIITRMIKLPHLSEWVLMKLHTYSKGLNEKRLGQTVLEVSSNPKRDIQLGALFSYPAEVNSITIRVGVSFVSAEQACRNAEEEIGEKSFEDVRAESVKQWNDRLGRLEIPLQDTEEDIAVMMSVRGTPSISTLDFVPDIELLLFHRFITDIPACIVHFWLQTMLRVKVKVSNFFLKFSPQV